jgi:hypothetical protein
MACTPALPPPQTISHSGCWYKVHHLVKTVQYSGPVLEVWEDVWEARCREDYLERIQRAGCKILELNPHTVVVSDCKEFIGLTNG